MVGFLVIVAIVVALVWALVAYGRWWNLHGGGKVLREKEARRKAEREAGVVARGWKYDGTVDGNIHYRISGTSESGVAWMIHYDSDQSSSSSTPKLSFVAAQLAAPGYSWYIHDKPTFDMMQKRTIKALVGGIATLVAALSDGVKLKRDFYLNARALPVGGAAFRERYVLAAVEEKWGAVLNSGIERMVLDWPAFKQSMTRRDNCVSAEVSDKGLCVHVCADAPDLAVIEHIARLGQSLVESHVAVAGQ